MRKRNKLFDTWRKQVDVRIEKQLNEWFGEPVAEGIPREVILRVDEAPFPEEHLPKGKVSWKEFEHVILPRAYEKDIGSVYLDIVTELKKRIIDTHPDRYAVATTMRRSGRIVEDFILDKVYNSARVSIELGNLLDTLDIEIIPEFEDVHIKTRDPATGPQKLDKETVRKAYKSAVERLVKVYSEGKELKPIWIRPVKGNSKERVIVTFSDGLFEMYYKSFPDYCCQCIICEDEDPKKALSEFAKIFIRSVYKHYWPDVEEFLNRLK